MTLPDGLRKFAFPLFCILMVLIIVVMSVLTGDFGRIGPDNDDMMRLVQIRDYFEGGQDWFDTYQYRMGLEGGTAMHWSRLVDIPVIFLIAFFDIFISYPQAEALAISIWPPVSAMIVLTGLYIGGKNLGGPSAGWFASGIAALFLMTHYRFSAGAIDHHNIQIGLLSLSIGLALDPKHSAKAFLGSGIALGLSLAIGADIYIFGGIICGFIAMLWLSLGRSAREGAIAFGVGLAGALLCAFIAVIAPQNYSVVACDALSLVTISAGLVGGLGLAFSAFFFSEKSLAIRLASLAGLAILCVVLLLLQAPQCLSNPLSALPADVKLLWLERVNEAKPLLSKPKDYFLTAPMAIGGAVVAFIYAALQILRGRNWAYALPAVLLFCTIGATLYQVRFFVFAQFFAFLILGVWAASLHGRKEGSGNRNLGYLAVLLIAIPFAWAIPGLLLMPQDKATENAAAKADGKKCYSETVLDYIEDMPTGKFAAVNNATSRLLLKTDHSALTGNYHRNAAGIEAMIRIFTSDPQTAQSYLKDNQIDYVLYCSAASETKTLGNHNPQGLMAALNNGDIPSYLSPIKTLEDGLVTVFKYTPKD